MTEIDEANRKPPVNPGYYLLQSIDRLPLTHYRPSRCGSGAN
jgi:hypothetical protein